MEAKIYNFNKWIGGTNPEQLKAFFIELLLKSGFKILQHIEHYFEPMGYTVIFLLAESHLAIHTFPEEDKSYIELSSCVKQYYDDFRNNIDNSAFLSLEPHHCETIYRLV